MASERPTSDGGREQSLAPDAASDNALAANSLASAVSNVDMAKIFGERLTDPKLITERDAHVDAQPIMD